MPLWCEWLPSTPGAILPWLQGAQGNSSCLLQGTFYSMGIMTPSLCVMGGCQSTGGLDTTTNEKGWKDLAREETETQQRNRNHFSVDTRRSGVLSYRLLTTMAGQSSVRAQHTRGRRRPLGPEGLATLALRPLNRQPAGVLALHWTTFCRNHHYGVRTLSERPVCKKRQA